MQLINLLINFVLYLSELLLLFNFTYICLYKFTKINDNKLIKIKSNKKLGDN